MKKMLLLTGKKDFEFQDLLNGPESKDFVIIKAVD